MTRELITKCAGPKAEWRTLDRMSSTTHVAKSAINDVLERLGDAVKTRGGDRDVEHLIDGDPDELLVRAGLMVAQPEQSAADSSAEIAGLRAKLADANAEIERLKSALHEKVVEMIAATLAANGETKPTVDDVVMTALGRGLRSRGPSPRSSARRRSLPSPSRCTRAASRRPKPIWKRLRSCSKPCRSRILKAAKPDDGPWIKLLWWAPSMDPGTKKSPRRAYAWYVWRKSHGAAHR